MKEVYQAADSRPIGGLSKEVDRLEVIVSGLENTAAELEKRLDGILIQTPTSVAGPKDVPEPVRCKAAYAIGCLADRLAVIRLHLEALNIDL